MTALDPRGLAVAAARRLQPSLPADVLPPGRVVELAGRGTTFAAHRPGAPGAPTLVLLHGLVATGYLNWFPAFRALAGAGFGVLAVDHHGHGRGVRCEQAFRLDACADDVAAVAAEMGVERFVAVGYSMGGPIAQLLWRRHRERVEGLVLCATCRTFRGSTRETVFYSLLSATVAAARLARRAQAAAGGPRPFGEEEAKEGPRRLPLASWAVSELRRTSPGAVLQAVADVGRFSSRPWLGDVDVPTAVVVTTRDTLVPPERQRRMARAISGATVHEVDANHAACFFGARRFVPALVEACQSVAARLPA
jgi:3-oxoadipate enol-lactonase